MTVGRQTDLHRLDLDVALRGRAHGPLAIEVVEVLRVCRPLATTRLFAKPSFDAERRLVLGELSCGEIPPVRLAVLDRTSTEHVRDRRWLRVADDPEPGVSVGSGTIVDSGKRFSERGVLCECGFGRCRHLVGRGDPLIQLRDRVLELLDEGPLDGSRILRVLDLDHVPGTTERVIEPVEDITSLVQGVGM